MNQRLLALTVLALVAMMLAVSCGSADEPTPATGEPQRGGVLRLGMTESSFDFDPHWWSSITIKGLISDTLLLRHPETDAFVPGGLAESWDVTPDFLTWTFKLAKNIKYHDGTPFNANEMVASYQRGAEFGVVFKIYGPPGAQFSAEDEFTFVVKSPQVYGPTLDHLSWPAYFSVTNETWRAKLADPAEYERNPSGTGLFKLKEWVVGDHVTLERNADFNWGPSFVKNQGPARIDEIFIKFIEEEATLNAALKAGEIDVAYAPNQFANELRQDNNFEMFTKSSGTLRGVGMNYRRWPFDDVSVRRALMVAVDRPRINTVVNHGEGFPQYGQLVRALPFYNEAFEQESAILLAYNADKARKMLLEAGFEPGPDGVLQRDGKRLEVDFIQTGAEIDVKTGILVQSQLQDIGFDVNLVTLETAIHNSRRNSGDWDIFHEGYRTLTADILAFFWHPDKGINRSGYEDAAFATILDKSRHSTGDERAKAYLAVLKSFRDDAVTLPLHNPNRNTVVNKRVKDFLVHKNSIIWNLNDTWIEQ